MNEHAPSDVPLPSWITDHGDDCYTIDVEAYKAEGGELPIRLYEIPHFDKFFTNPPQTRGLIVFNDTKRPLINYEWKEPLPNGELMNWRMEEKPNGDRDFSMSCDIRVAIPAIPTGDANAEPYIYTPIWPIDPNAPVIDDDYDEWDEDI